MRVLYVHNSYQWSGGEDRVFEDEVELLRRNGHQVWTYQRNNSEIIGSGSLATASVTLWNPRSYREVTQLIREHRPQLVHCGNTFPLISPSVYWAAHHQGLPVLQTLHNFRLLCANSTLFREGQTCQLCLSRLWPWPAVQHACYRDNRAASLVVAGWQTLHRSFSTWKLPISRFIAVSDYVAKTFGQSGLRMAPIRVKPNFVANDPGPGSGEGAMLCLWGAW